jgi:hypothetical protein
VLEDEVRDYLRTAVALGREDAAGMVQAAVEYFEDEHDAAEIEALAWPAVREEIAAHLEAQKMWPERTDNDRLDDAFRRLDEAGVVARQDFSCCLGCGVGEIGTEARGYPRPRGYVFYHQQDAERAAEGEDLFLAYGPEEFGEKVGARVVAALDAEGLATDWSGSVDQRIRVRLRWGRRRHPDGGELSVSWSGGPGERLMGMPELRDVLRRLPAKPSTYVSAQSPNGSSCRSPRRRAASGWRRPIRRTGSRTGATRHWPRRARRSPCWRPRDGPSWGRRPSEGGDGSTLAPGGRSKRRQKPERRADSDGCGRAGHA